MLSDLGAEVIKVEPPEGDLTRFAQPRVNSLSSYFIQQNIGKQNISLDLSKPEASALIMRLIPFCDVVVENFRPGVMSRLGLSAERMMEANSRLIVASISGYGATGPWQGRRAYAPELQNTKAMRSDASMQTTRTATATCTPHLKQRLQFLLRCTSVNTRAPVNTSISPWLKPCCM
jgi:crotonobetainyl-CoA:carnitine CoA-transferase CaiB-like acyl-CoA transferase